MIITTCEFCKCRPWYEAGIMRVHWCSHCAKAIDRAISNLVCKDNAVRPQDKEKGPKHDHVL